MKFVPSCRRTALIVAALLAPAFAQQKAQYDEIEYIRLTPRGFLPAAITRTPGAFLLRVRNETGMPSVTLTLDNKNNSSRISQASLSAAVGRNHSQVLALAPGTYVLQESSHPKWTMAITIKAH